MAGLLTTDRIVRSLTGRLAPHLGHQKRWESRDGVAIYCLEHDAEIMTMRDMIDLGIPLLSPQAQDRVRESVSRWIRDNSPEDAKLVFKV